MTKRTRTILFFLLGVIFILAVPTLIFYSQGYRLDWEERKFSQVGAFYFNAVPTRVEVFVNGQSIGKTAFVLGTTLTKNFAPGTYHVRIQKEGYHSWEKRLEIISRQVTENKHIALIPIDPTFIVLQDNVLDFWAAPNKSEVLLQKSNSQNTWALVLWDTQNNAEYFLYESPHLQDEIQDVQWSSDSNSFLFHVVSQEQVHSYVQQIDRTLLNRQSTEKESLQIAAQLRISLNKILSNPQQTTFSPFEKNQLLFLGSSQNSSILSQFDYTQNQTPSILARNVTAFLAKNAQIVWLDQEGILWQQTNRNTQATPLNEIPFLPLPETLYTLYAADKEIFLKENQMLYILNQGNRSFEEFFTPFQEMLLSPDGNKIALSTGKELWLHFLKEDREQPSRAEGDRVFLTRFSEPITNLTWFTSHYLLFSLPNAITISEIDDRDHLNMVELASFPRSDLLWQDSTKTLLVQTREQIRVSEKLLP